mmetsp:Transcript_2294/g.5088  ORF Transcript_2294/g.5088 Transcript_2294/m.5088 type:complete len:199 (-) Transcript_2294:94-690(-)|eukprot:CAMPEP_0201214854 /NCGR_PEP_ID=MMETSP0851-20130426/188628_1 /ASSEMBLY_ACC=CAM_ASM_000631 /TAXON_ID=183588 /ORGANISM="Pseudo-nitzschia fraudulenta, Strain WWA7" /LENGTH=198 /DNA_ID=CAMNT_0047504229 /DNA_START=504 /DNA_END=1100 /DNA_ORIENTATION=-
MKRHLICDGNEKEDHQHCGTNIAILGRYRALIGNDRSLQSEKRQKTKAQQQQPSPSVGIKIDDPKLLYTELVSSAVTFFADECRRMDDDAPRATRGSRSNSLSSEVSVYRSYEMELPTIQQLGPTSAASLPNPPRLPTARQLPGNRDSALPRLNARQYGDCIDAGNEQRDNSNNKTNRIHDIDSNAMKRFCIQTVIYR